MSSCLGRLHPGIKTKSPHEKHHFYASFENVEHAPKTFSCMLSTTSFRRNLQPSPQAAVSFRKFVACCFKYQEQVYISVLLDVIKPSYRVTSLHHWWLQSSVSGFKDHIDTPSTAAHERARDHKCKQTRTRNSCSSLPYARTHFCCF
jgi:hypothetical protein